MPAEALLARGNISYVAKKDDRNEEVLQVPFSIFEVEVVLHVPQLCEVIQRIQTLNQKALKKDNVST